ncbi:hypothetical protein [Pseudomonas sp. TE50-2]|uniref:hypothetical protein n=1 Tax=Pseudomonas sp. TE50-2 TaxID=3142707 RepID=UPI003465F42A
MPRKTTRSPRAIQQQRKYAESPHEMGDFRNALALLPEGEEALLSHASYRLEQFNDAMLCADAQAIEAAGLFYWAAVWRLNGDTAWACKLDGGGLDRVQKHLAPAAGVPTRWGECGEWLLEVGDMRMWVRVGCSSLGGAHGVMLHAVDADSRFLNEHGEHQLQLWPDAFLGLDFARALRQEVKRLLATECQSVVLRESARAGLKRPAWMAVALGSVTHNGQQTLALSALDAPADEAQAAPGQKGPMSNAERQRLFRQRSNERKAKAEAEGLLTVVLSARDRLYLSSALDYYDFQCPLAGEFMKGNLLELYRRLQSGDGAPVNWPADEDREAWYSRQLWHVICDDLKRKQATAQAELVAARAEIDRLHALLRQIGGEFGSQSISTNQQINKSTDTPTSAGPEAFSLQLLRRHKWKHSREEDVALVAVQVVPHEGQWMWSACLSSQNGNGSSYAPLPKWGKFAASPGAALQQGLAEVRAFRERITQAERKRLDVWLAGEAAERLAELGVAGDEENNKSTNQQMLMI